MDLIKQWEEEENHAFQGWDFSHLDGRWISPELPWDYVKTIKLYLKDTDILLDMGTGGGEVLLTIGHPYQNTYTTEAYTPNYELCKKVLSPLGITVVQADVDENTKPGDRLPFDDDFFDVIINRHESFDLAEVARLLKPGGYFITQQVGNKNSIELMQRLNDDYKEYMPDHTVKRYTDRLGLLGFEVIQTDEMIESAKIYDVGALVFTAKIIEWEFPGFSVKTHLQKILGFQKEIEEKGFLESTEHRFIIVAKNIIE